MPGTASAMIVEMEEPMTPVFRTTKKIVFKTSIPTPKEMMSIMLTRSVLPSACRNPTLVKKIQVNTLLAY